MTETSNRLSVCVFCASSESVSADERAVAAELGRGIAERGWRLVYGGGGIGLMGEVARAVMAGGGEVFGVIPRRLVEREVALPEITELVQTETMRERKHLMDSEADAFIVLPGGIGTLEELVEVLTLKLLGYHSRPIVLLDARDYWKPLLDQIDAMIREQLSPQSLLYLFDVVRTPAEALEAVTRPQAEMEGLWIGQALETIEDEP